MKQMMYRTILKFKTLFCFLLFAAPFVEFVIPGGDTYLASAVGFTAFAGILFEVQYRKNTYVVTWEDVLFFICIVYATIRMPRPVDMTLCIKLVAITGIWCYGRLNANADFPGVVARWMIGAGLCMSAIGLLQVLGVLKSLHSDFIVTGTFGNPGPFGGYLAITTTLLFSYMLQEKLSSVTKKFLFLCFMMTVLALVLSDSRSAWCAAGVSILLYLYLRFPLKKRLLKLGCAVLLTVLVPVTTILLYYYRPGSVDARILIWQVCGEIIAQVPFMGVGTGRFAAFYMPAQGEYLITAMETVRHRAADNQFAYNEMLTILCEQGVLGLLWNLVFWGVVISGLKSSFKLSNRNILLFPVVSLLVFAQFSYPLNIWSFVCLLPFMPAVGLGQGRVLCGKMPDSLSIYCRRLLLIIFSGVCIVFLSIGFVLRWKSQTWINDYSVFATSSEHPGKVRDWYIRHDPYLLACCADAALLRIDYKMALDCMECLRHYAWAAQWNIKLGECYEEMGDTLRAVECYKTASRMMPGLMYPVFAEFNLYRKENKKEEALSLARKMITFKPKVKNRKTERMKREALLYIRTEGE